ncbi:hypothetical protein KAI87_05635, partial [Myxococcota bacterium]|nr:hypothetical protein [Myxococcota bacterium]
NRFEELTNPSARVQAEQGMASKTSAFFTFLQSYQLGGPGQLGFMTKGPVTSSLSLSLRIMLQVLIETHIQKGGEAAEREHLVELFHLAVPDPESLDRFSPNAPVMMMGFFPQPESWVYKIYFNTRLTMGAAVSPLSHREQLENMISHAGLFLEPSLFDTLYNDHDDSKFHGVGFDFNGLADIRAKLYIHLARPKAAARLLALAEYLNISKDEILELVDLMEEIGDDLSAPNFEIALSLRKSHPPDLKVTNFFSARQSGTEHIKVIESLLKRHSHSRQALQAAINIDTSVENHYRIHALGLEVPNRRKKVNIYVAPGL